MGLESETYAVSKAIVLVKGEDARYLMSIKRDPASNNDSKLEFLGGRMEAGETPGETLRRELGEEEVTGRLAGLIDDQQHFHVQHQLGNALHHLFSLEIPEEEYEQLVHHPDESYGFRLLTIEDVTLCPNTFTRKTNLIIETLGLHTLAP